MPHLTRTTLLTVVEARTSTCSTWEWVDADPRIICCSCGGGTSQAPPPPLPPTPPSPPPPPQPPPPPCWDFYDGIDPNVVDASPATRFSWRLIHCGDDGRCDWLAGAPSPLLIRQLAGLLTQLTLPRLLTNAKPMLRACARRRSLDLRLLLCSSARDPHDHLIRLRSLPLDAAMA